MNQPNPHPEIHGHARTVRELLSNRRYGLEYYQREYSWEQTHVDELLEDLTTVFENQREVEHTQQDVVNYRPYFLGPIITSSRDGTRYLIDGQQRLTTLSLLLIHLLHLVPPDDDIRGTLQRCVYSTSFGKKSFNLDVPERASCMSALLNEEEFDSTKSSASVRNLWTRYQDLSNLFDLEASDLKLFIDWLLEKVIFVEITTTDGNMAYEIFETMNDRGLSLTPTDMLKSYLLANVQDANRVRESDDFWRDRIKKLGDTEDNADSDFFKAWLRASYAEKVRQRKRGAKPQDWDLIGTEFHKWVRDNEAHLGLQSRNAFYEFVTRKFDRMSQHYLRLLRAQRVLTSDLEFVRYTARTGFTLQLTVVLAPVTPDDDDPTADRKMNSVARYLDCMVARRMVNFRNFGYSTMQYAMFQLCKEIRGLSVEDLRRCLDERLHGLEQGFEAVPDYRLHRRNGKHVRYLLARITDFVDRGCGGESTFEQLVDRGRDDPYEIEHIWPNKWEPYQDEFESIHDFEEARNRFGGLLLLPKSFNASYGALPYEAKLRHYRGQNHLLAKSLHPDTYDHNPGFRSFINRYELPFKPYPDGFSSNDMMERQELYTRLCEVVWPLTAFDVEATE